MAMRILLLSLLSLLGAAILAPTAHAGFGSPIMPSGDFGLGVVGRQFTRDIFAEDDAGQDNPQDTFGYVALETRLGLWRNRFDLAFELGRATSEEAGTAGVTRDYLDYELGVTGRGLVYEHPEKKFNLIAGVHYRETVDFDRSLDRTHKLRRHLAAFALFGRPLEVGGRPGRLYGGPEYSRHEFDEYVNDPNRPHTARVEAETRGNVQLTAGLSLFLLDPLGAAFELSYRNDLSFAGSAMWHF